MIIENLLDYVNGGDKLIIITDAYMLQQEYPEIIIEDFACNIDDSLWSLRVGKIEPIIADGVATLLVHVY